MSAQPARAAVRQVPRWEAWVGIGGILYARRRKSSPPVVFRAATAEELATKITEYENAQP